MGKPAEARAFAQERDRLAEHIRNLKPRDPE